MRRAFFNIISGQETYKKTWQQTRNFKLLSKIVIKVIISRFFKQKNFGLNYIFF